MAADLVYELEGDLAVSAGRAAGDADVDEDGDGRCVEQVAHLVRGVEGEVGAHGVRRDARAVHRVAEVAAVR